MGAGTYIQYLQNSGRWDSNPRHSAWEADILPLNYARKQLVPYVQTNHVSQSTATLCDHPNYTFYLEIFPVFIIAGLFSSARRVVDIRRVASQRSSRQAGKKASYNVLTYSSGRLRKSIREKTVAVRELFAYCQRINIRRRQKQSGSISRV